MKVITLFTVASSLVAAMAPASAFAQTTTPAAPDSAEVEDLRRDLRQLRGQLQALKSAVAEAAEFDRMSAAALSRALNILGGEPGAASEARPSESTVRAPSLDGRPATSVAAAAPVRRRPVVIPDPTGAVRGKVQVPAGEPVAYVFVENVRGAAVSGNVKIEQVNKQFVPGWAVVQVGTKVEFPNKDNIYHNVFSLSPGNAFDLGLYSSDGEAKVHRFLEPGGVDVFCNIHPQMAASVLVVPSRHFAKVKADGTFELAGVPAGRRKIVAWAPGSRLSSEWVEVSTGQNSAVTLQLESKGTAHKRKDGRPYGSYE